jgi:hypothetical protein
MQPCLFFWYYYHHHRHHDNKWDPKYPSYLSYCVGIAKDQLVEGIHHLTFQSYNHMVKQSWYLHGEGYHCV